MTKDISVVFAYTKRRMIKVALQQDREVLIISLVRKGVYIIAIDVYTYCICVTE